MYSETHFYRLLHAVLPPLSSPSILPLSGHTHIHTYIYVYTYTHMYIHMYTYTYIHRDFLEVRQVLSKYDGDLRDPLWCPQERPVPKRVARGPLGIPLPSKLGPKTLCGASAGTCGFLSSADMNLGVLLDTPQGSQSSSRVGECTCAFLPSCSSSVRFPSRGSRDLWLSLEASSRGFPTRLSHRAVPRATMV